MSEEYEEYDVYGEWDLDDGYSSNIEIGFVDLPVEASVDQMPDRIEINGIYYIAEK